MSTLASLYLWLLSLITVAPPPAQGLTSADAPDHALAYPAPTTAPERRGADADKTWVPQISNGL